MPVQESVFSAAFFYYYMRLQKIYTDGQKVNMQAVYTVFMTKKITSTEVIWVSF